jgi:hypothetical protein
MTDLERSHAELRAAVLLAGKEIRKLTFERADSRVLFLLRRILREARAVARKAVGGASVSMMAFATSWNSAA